MKIPNNVTTREMAIALRLRAKSQSKTFTSEERSWLLCAAQMIECLDKDTERLDWLQSSDLTLYSWEEGNVWARAGIYTIREYIDIEMEK